jgi:Fe-S cluster assembly protein SufD
MAVQVAQLESYLEAFTDFTRQRPSETPAWLRDLRESAFARFCETGFPTTRNEDWRFTNLASLVRTPFRLPREEETTPLQQKHTAAWQISGAAARLIFINGHYHPGLSTLERLPAGIKLCGLRQAIRDAEPVLSRHLGRYVNITRDPFCALNTAFMEDGAFLLLPRNTVADAPIHLLFVSTASEVPLMTHPRNLIIVEEQAQISIVEEYVSFGEEVPAFSNAVTELVAGENATVIHTLIEHEHGQAFNFSTLRIEQARSANVASHSLLLGGGLVRNNVHPVLAGEGGECLINGLFIGSGHQHLDNYMQVEHAKPHCASRQFYNGILDGQSHGVFHGRIIVHKDAQKTDAKQTNRNLLLSDAAQIDTKPQLEIYADDVKCTHGATIGQIEENALFYLQSRGIAEPEARRLLLGAFAGECLERIAESPLRAYAEAALEQRLTTLAGNSRTSGSGNFASRNWEELG